MNYSITYDEVREYVERLDDDAPVGYCNNPYHCIIAEALRHKYPDLLGAEVLPHYFSNTVDLWATERGGFRAIVASPDLQRLNTLAREFDRLLPGSRELRVTKSQVMPLFEEN